jgi:hypothetical protein
MGDNAILVAGLWWNTEIRPKTRRAFFLPVAASAKDRGRRRNFPEKHERDAEAAISSAPLMGMLGLVGPAGGELCTDDRDRSGQLRKQLRESRFARFPFDLQKRNLSLLTGMNRLVGGRGRKRGVRTVFNVHMST